MYQAKANLLEKVQSSRQKRSKQFFILFLIIFFTLIICAIISVFTVLKHHTESQSLSANQVDAIRAACKVTGPHHRLSCIKFLSSLHNPRHKIHASDVFRLSVGAAFDKCLSIHELPQELTLKPENKNIRPVLTDCQSLFNDSLNQLNRSMIMITKNYDKETLDFHDGTIKILRNLIYQAAKNVDKCLDGLDAGKVTTQNVIKVRIREAETYKVTIREAETYILLSLFILENKDSVREIFDPSFRSILASFMLKREEYMLGIAVFCSRYLFVVLLFCSLLRVLFK